MAYTYVPKAKLQHSEEIRRQVNEWLDRGGKITVVTKGRRSPQVAFKTATQR